MLHWTSVNSLSGSASYRDRPETIVHSYRFDNKRYYLFPTSWIKLLVRHKLRLSRQSNGVPCEQRAQQWSCESNPNRERAPESRVRGEFECVLECGTEQCRVYLPKFAERLNPLIVENDMVYDPHYPGHRGRGGSCFIEYSTAP